MLRVRRLEGRVSGTNENFLGFVILGGVYIKVIDVIFLPEGFLSKVPRTEWEARREREYEKHWISHRVLSRGYHSRRLTDSSSPVGISACSFGASLMVPMVNKTVSSVLVPETTTSLFGVRAVTLDSCSTGTILLGERVASICCRSMRAT
eukprot:scaffold46516_cov183-Amphora_coffeaeformis.AAC.2